MDFAPMLVDLLRGLAVSVEIFLCTLAIALPLGFPIALGRMSDICILSFDFRGRSGRGEYWASLFCICVFQAIALVAGLFLVIGVRGILGVFSGVLIFLIFGALTVAFLAACVRRLHDLGLNGWWAVLLYFIPAGHFVIGCIPGKTVANEFWIASRGNAKGIRLSSVFRLYISVVRGTPLMLQILFVYFAPYILFGLPLSNYPRFLATVLAFGLNYAAYFAEIYRGGILSIDRGQTEAAVALGLGKGQAFFRVILPQVVKRVIPAVGNEVITLVKDTSLAFTIAVAEMFTIAKQLSSANTTMAPLVAAGVFYYVFNFVVAWSMERVEKRLSYYE